MEWVKGEKNDALLCLVVKDMTFTVEGAGGTGKKAGWRTWCPEFFKVGNKVEPVLYKDSIKGVAGPFIKSCASICPRAIITNKIALGRCGKTDPGLHGPAFCRPGTGLIHSRTQGREGEKRVVLFCRKKEA